MTVADVQTYHLQVPLATPIPASATRPLSTALSIHLVRLTCADGSSAWGEGRWSDAEEFSAAVRLLGEVPVGADPLDRGALWERMVDRLTGRTEPLPGGVAALSALDIALWDLAGRQLDLPVYRLIGGRRFARLNVCAAGIYHEEPAVAARQARALLERGFRAVQIKFGAGPERDLAVFDAVRAAIGPQVPLLVDANQAYADREVALAVGVELDRREAFWYEEPMPPGDWSDYVALRSALDTPIAGGKCLRSPGAFLQAFRMGALDVALPEVCLCGGITGLLKIAELARWFGVRIAPHNGASPLGALASAHAVVTVPTYLMTEIEATVIPATERLLDPPLRLEDGFLALPETPGLGVTVNAQFVEQFAVER